MRFEKNVLYPPFLDSFVCGTRGIPGCQDCGQVRPSKCGTHWRVMGNGLEWGTGFGPSRRRQSYAAPGAGESLSLRRSGNALADPRLIEAPARGYPHREREPVTSSRCRQNTGRAGVPCPRDNEPIPAQGPTRPRLRRGGRDPVGRRRPPRAMRASEWTSSASARHWSVGG